MAKRMGIFELYDSATWNKNVGYPLITIREPDQYENIYSGRNPNEYFEYFDINQYQQCDVAIWFDAGTFAPLGTIAELNNKLPSFELSFKKE